MINLKMNERQQKKFICIGKLTKLLNYTIPTIDYYKSNDKEKDKLKIGEQKRKRKIQSR